MATKYPRKNPTTSFRLAPEHIELLDQTAKEYRSNRSWVLARILDRFMSAPTNLIRSNVAAMGDEEAAD